MSSFCRRIDDPTAASPLPPIIDSAEVALATLVRAAHRPARDEVIAMLLTPDYVGETILVVDGTDAPDAVVEVMEYVAEAAAEAGVAHVFVLASVRPGGGLLPGDVDRWAELSDLAEGHGCELADWFVIGDRFAWCPRDLLVEPPRWPTPSDAPPEPWWS